VKRIAREPLLQFILLGALIFLVHRVAAKEGAAPIAVDPHTRDELHALFRQRQQRAPSAQEAAELERRWLDDELLFREGLRLELVRQDSALREQLVSRMRGLIAASIAERPVTERELADFFQRRRDDYRVPETITLREYAIAHGPDADDRARAVMGALRRGEQVLTTMHDRSSREQLATVFGEELADRILALSPGSLQTLRSQRAIHVVQVLDHAAAYRPPLAEVRAAVERDLRAERAQRAFDDELARLRAEVRE
jgi:hypothetical protein